MKIIGLTGGMASGKSTVAQHWESLGAYVMYADAVAKSLMTEDPALVQQLKETFGEETYLPDGRLNKPHLRREAFEKGRVESLNGLVHPAVYRESRRLMQEKAAEGYPVFVKEAALLLKNGRPEGFDAIVMVDAPEAQRIRRVARRDALPEAEVKSRMQNQQSAEEMRELSDIIIENTGSRSELLEKAETIYQQLLQA
jgi:dephospho-CoA kinase